MEQMTIDQYTARIWYERDGKKRTAPEWANDERCGTCKHWDLLPKEEQPPCGWGVKGQCNVIHAPEQKRYEITSQSSYCCDYERRL